VAGIEPFDAIEADHRADTLAWIDSEAPIHRTAKPATPPRHLVSYCVLVDPGARSALLVDHRNAQRWLPTGGHVELDEHPAEAARREMAEELAISPPFHPATGPTPLFLTVSETGGRSTPHTDVSLWFVFVGAEGQRVQADPREFAGARWWPFDDIGATGSGSGAPEGSRFDIHLPRFLAKLDRPT
jgi:8-oxo-dGTP pyrophosphatase MutT (NUDIX family)